MSLDWNHWKNRNAIKRILIQNCQLKFQSSKYDKWSCYDWVKFRLKSWSWGPICLSNIEFVRPLRHSWLIFVRSRRNGNSQTVVLCDMPSCVCNEGHNKPNTFCIDLVWGQYNLWLMGPWERNFASAFGNIYV